MPSEPTVDGKVQPMSRFFFSVMPITGAFRGRSDDCILHRQGLGGEANAIRANLDGKVQPMSPVARFFFSVLPMAEEFRGRSDY